MTRKALPDIAVKRFILTGLTQDLGIEMRADLADGPDDAFGH
jgi:hypothetical protein